MQHSEAFFVQVVRHDTGETGPGKTLEHRSGIPAEIQQNDLDRIFARLRGFKDPGQYPRRDISLGRSEDAPQHTAAAGNHLPGDLVATVVELLRHLHHAPPRFLADAGIVPVVQDTGNRGSGQTGAGGNVAHSNHKCSVSRVR